MIALRAWRIFLVKNVYNLKAIGKDLRLQNPLCFHACLQVSFVLDGRPAYVRRDYVFSAQEAKEKCYLSNVVGANYYNFVLGALNWTLQNASRYGAYTSCEVFHTATISSKYGNTMQERSSKKQECASRKGLPSCNSKTQSVPALCIINIITLPATRSTGVQSKRQRDAT